MLMVLYRYYRRIYTEFVSIELAVGWLVVFMRDEVSSYMSRT